MTKFITLLALFILVGINQSYAQQITPQQQNVLNNFDVSATDHRGVEFTADTTNIHATYTNVKTAIEAFFADPIKRDFTRIRINNNINQAYYNSPLGVMDLVNIYIEITTDQTLSNE